MEGTDLLLGNDFLKQFGKLHIDYQSSKTLITVGDLPLHLIEPQKLELAESSKNQTTEGGEYSGIFHSTYPDSIAFGDGDPAVYSISTVDVE